MPYAPKGISLDGYEFLGWWSGSQKLTSETLAEKDTCYMAYWNYTGSYELEDLIDDPEILEQFRQIDQKYPMSVSMPSDETVENDIDRFIEQNLQQKDEEEGHESDEDEADTNLIIPSDWTVSETNGEFFKGVLTER